MRVAVVTVNYRCADAILASLEATAAQIADAGGHWFIVDNQSDDGSVSILRAALDKIATAELVEADRNGGFGYGNNQIIKRVISGELDAEYVYLLNPDAIPETGAIELMADYLDQFPHVAIVGSALLDDDGAPTDSMFRFPSLLSEIESALAIGPVSRLLSRKRLAYPPLSVPGPVDWVSGASFMARAAVFRAVGTFDEDFFLYWEEVELCHRVRKAGYEIHGLPAAKVKHVGGASTGISDHKRFPLYWHKSRSLYFSKTNRGRPQVLLNALIAISLAVGRCWASIRGKPGKPPRFLRDHLTTSFLSAKSFEKWQREH